MLNVAVRCALALVLVASAVLKLGSPRASQAALSTFGLRSSGARWAVWAGLVAAEVVLAVAVAGGWGGAAYAAAVLMTAFAAVIAVALLRGRAGAPCACFGSRSRVTDSAVARNLFLAGAFAAVPSLPGAEPSAVEWLALGLGLSLIGVAGLGVAVLALAREIGMLRLRLGPESALEIAEEGPEVGSRSRPLADRLDLASAAELHLAVFTSTGCRVCRSLGPALASFEHDPLVEVRVFEEESERELWEALGVPGSPYAVVLDVGGFVLAKGTFNGLGQLESVLASAERRVPEIGATAVRERSPEAVGG